MSAVLEPVCSGAELVARIRAARSTGALHVWRTGQAGVVVVLPSGTTVAVDPYLSDHCEAVLGAPFDHRRSTRSPLTAPELGPLLDVVVCTHDHLDHLDVPTMRTLARSEHVVAVAPESCREQLGGLGWPEPRLHLTRGGDRVEVAGLGIDALAVPHEDFDLGPTGAPYQGYVVGDGRARFVHLGDALDHPEVRAALRDLAGPTPYDVLLAPVNGRDEVRAALGFAGNMDAEEAVGLAGSVPVSCTVPMHYDMFAQNVDADAVPRFRAAALDAGLPHAVLAVSETWTPAAVREREPVTPHWMDRPSHHAWLADRTDDLLRFYRASGQADGSFAWLDGAGDAVPAEGRQLWIHARMVYAFALGEMLGRPGCGPLVERGLEGLRHGPLHDRERGGWYWAVDADGRPTDDTKQAYGHAFVLLAAAAGRLAGHETTDLWDEVAGLLDERFWDEDAGLFVDTWDAGFAELEDYRGQNANMHLVEALMLAHEVGGEERFLDRAVRIARRLIHDITAGNEWRLPEHYDGQWRPLPDYGRDGANLFRPYGSTVGHWIEWSRLLLQLRHAVGPDRETWLLDAARTLFDRAVAEGWDPQSGGFAFSTDWDGAVLDADRYHWVIAEAIGAAVALRRVTGDAGYEAWYRTFWDFAAEHLVEADGSWIHQLDGENRPSNDAWDGKPDLYHALQATLFARVPFGPSLALALAEGEG